MTDYNDGKWHGWNGGDCPVDPEALVQIIYSSGDKGCDDGLAGDLRWNRIDSMGDIIAFRVTKPALPKPREYWIVGHQAWDTFAEAYNACDRGEKPIHVREVLPETPTRKKTP